jgi:hypothetical protein
MNRCLLALLLTVCGTAPVAAADNVIAVIDGCIHRLDPAVDVGYAHIAERCPDLASTLTSSRYAAWLPPDWNKPENELSVGGLVELRRLLSHSELPPTVRAPRVARLAGVLNELHRNDTGQGSFWARFKQWLREIFMPQPGAEDQGWLERLIGGLDLSQTVLRASVWGAVFLVLLLAGAVIVNELRVAGWWRSGPRRRRHEPGGAGVGRGAPSLDDVERARADVQPHLLLQLIIRRLTEQKRLPPARALTLSELERAARLSDERDRERLAALTAACERARFAEHVGAPLLMAALARGRELLGSLETPPPQPRGSS